MQFSTLFAAASFIAAVSAVANFTNSEFNNIQAGKPFKITWTGATHPVTLKLKNGPALAQQYVSTIATGLSGNEYTWIPDTTLVDGTYNLEIDDGTEMNYSIQFPITGGTGTSSSAASSTSAPSAASTSASSTLDTSASSTSSSPSSTSSKSSSTTSSSSSTTSAPSVPTSNSAIQNGSPFALVILGALALAVMN